MTRVNTPIDRVLDAQFIKRWNIVGAVVDSNVAVHSFNVAMIAAAILDRMHTNPHLITTEEVCFYALTHDLAEVYNGDVPSPAKEAMAAMRINPDTLHRHYVPEMKPRPLVYEIVKMADVIDNYLFISEFGVGSRSLLAIEDSHSRMLAWDMAVSPEVARAAKEVYDYISNRGSDQDEKRNEAKEQDQKNGQPTQLRFSFSYMD